MIGSLAPCNQDVSLSKAPDCEADIETLPYGYVPIKPQDEAFIMQLADTLGERLAAGAS